MLVEVKVPALAESIADATLLEWYKKPGDKVKRGENLIDLETDKVTLEVAAPEDGILAEVRMLNGAIAHSQDVLAVINTDPNASVVAHSAAPVAPAVTLVETPATPAPESPPKHGPAVEKILAEQDLDRAAITAIPATGRDGWLTKGDVLRAIENTPPAPKPVPIEAAPIMPVPPATGERPEERVKMTRLRKSTAERLLAAQHNSAILTTFNEVDMHAVMDLRNRHQEIFNRQYGVRLGFMGFFVKATIEALKRFPIVNASVDGDDIIYHGYFDVGIAVGTERGLVVPILRDADQLTFAEIERQIADFGARARDGKLTIDELTGGNFTITNGGVFGSLLSTPILNPPQSAILGMHKVQERPVVEHGAIVIRPMMYLALSYDHRIIDGRDAVQFLVRIKEQLEDPARMLMEV